MNLVICAYAYKDKYQTGHNIQSDDTKNVYLKNSYVALRSCKEFNKDTEVAIVTNLQLSEYWKKLFDRSGIRIFVKDFDDYIFDENYGWSLAYYKLCALKYVTGMDYDNILILDTDTYTQRPFDDIWIECKHNILLSDISRPLYNKDYVVFCEEAQKFLKTDEYLTRWGGEFIAGNKKNLIKFISECDKIYAEMRATGFVTINGDEFIESVAAWKMRNLIKNSADYVFRFWTAYRWHYVCSNYSSNPVSVLHCPREKDHGFIKLFNYIVKHDKLPSAKKVYRKLNLDLFSYVKIEIIKNIAKLKN